MENKKNTITKAELVIFHKVFSGVKFKLDQQPCIDYLHLKIKISEEVEKIERSGREALKVVLAKFGYEDVKELPKDKIQEFEIALNGVGEKLQSEEVELDTHILTPDQLFSGVLDLEGNKDVSTEGKAILMKYLMK